MISFFGAAIFAFFASFILVPMLLGFLRALGLYTVVQEGTCQVYVLFGKVLAVLRTPGLHLLWLKMGPAALIVRWIGRCYVLDMRLDQRYLRSLPVNSEEGAPMGVGVWYEMAINDPVNYLFKNADPQGSLAANVSNAVVRSLSNMPLSDLLEDRHAMSLNVRNEVSPKSTEWGYRLGSVYVRKVHFRDVGMIRQIEAKVVNRLRQVTSAIVQDGTNQVNIIASTAERQAAFEFARAEAIRPQILGEAMKRITDDPEVGKALFDILEVQNIAEGSANVTLVGAKHPLLKPLIVANQESVNAR